MNNANPQPPAGPAPADGPEPPGNIPRTLARINAFIERGWLAYLKPTDANVWVVYNKFADNITGNCCPAQGTIARYLGTDVRNVQKARKRLIAAGLLQMVAVRGGFKKFGSIIRVCMPGETPSPPVNSTPGEIHPRLNSPLVDFALLPPVDSTPQTHHRTHQYIINAGENENGSGKDSPAAPAPTPQKRNPGRQTKPADPLPPIAASLNTPAFQTAWAEFIEFRRTEKRKPVGPMSARRLLHTLETFGPAQAVEAIHASIANGWTGIFPPSPTKGPTNGSSSTRPKSNHRGTEEYIPL